MTRIGLSPTSAMTTKGRLKVKVTRSRDASIWQVFAEKSRTKCPKTHNSLLVGRLLLPAQPTGNNAHQFQCQRSPGRLMLRPEVRHIFRTESDLQVRTRNFVYRCSTKTRIADKRHDLQGRKSRLQGHVVRLTGVDPLGYLRMKSLPETHKIGTEVAHTMCSRHTS